MTGFITPMGSGIIVSTDDYLHPDLEYGGENGMYMVK